MSEPEAPELVTVAINVCPACYAGRGPLPLGGQARCRTVGCAFEEEVRPSYDWKARHVLMVPADVVRLVDKAVAVYHLISTTDQGSGPVPGEWRMPWTGQAADRFAELWDALQPFFPPPPGELPVERIKGDVMAEREAAARLQEAMAKR
jgi:hypothetical protein